ncbi:MAG: hypothetical protein DRP91_01190 [Candidatus Neomarinimicrobiota bacterium]|nr:MAG: hypothetical protein DRP91_01190 [Candidatus Neomarinimicrobiota bacterium]
MVRKSLSLSILIYLFFATSYARFDSLKCAFGIDTLFLPIRNIDRCRKLNNTILLPYDDWGIKIASDYSGLPGYTIWVIRDNFTEVDPLFGNLPALWQESHFFKSKYLEGEINYQRAGYFEKPITGFKYYKGDYSFLNVSAFASGRYYDKGIWGLDFSNLGYDGRFGLLGSKYGVKTGESLAQNYRMGFETRVSTFSVTAWIFYNKYMPGIVNYSTSEYNYTFGGTDKEYRRGGYISLKKLTKTKNFQAGVLTSGFYYSRNTGNLSLKGEGIHNQIYFNIQKFSSNGSLGVNFRVFQNEFCERGGGNLSQTKANFLLTGDFNRNTTKILFETGIANLKPVAELSIKQNIFRTLYLNMGYYRRFHLYPLIFSVMPDTLNKAPDFDKGFISNIGELGIEWKTKHIDFNLGFRHTIANFYMPLKSSPSFQLLNFNLRRERRLFFFSNIDIRFKNWVEFINRFVYAPQSNRDINLVIYNISSLGGSFNILKNLKLSYYGSFWYTEGYEQLAWFEEVRSTGLIDFSVFNNEKLFLSFEIGARVKSFYIFYSFYNIQGRLFSSLPLMPYRNRLFIYGVKWWFIE